MQPLKLAVSVLVEVSAFVWLLVQTYGAKNTCVIERKLAKLNASKWTGNFRIDHTLLLRMGLQYEASSGERECGGICI